MKQITYDEVKRPADTTSKFIGLVSENGQKYILNSENDGYVFRCPTNTKWGHSGHHFRRDDACAKAMQVYQTTIYSFDTKEELNAWMEKE